MGRVADAAGIQFRVLNRSKGPAVQGPRAQADRKLYREAMQAAIRATPEPRGHRGCGRGPDRRGWRRRRHRHRRWPAHRCRRRGPHHRHLPERPDPYRRDARSRPAASARRRRSASASASMAWASAWAGSRPARRRASTDARSLTTRCKCSMAMMPPQPFSFLTESDHDAADGLPHHPYDGRDPRHHRGQSRPRADLFRRHQKRRPALLPLHRGQGRALQGARAATRSSSSPKASTTTPSIRTASRPRCRRTCSLRSSRPFRASSRRG